VSKSNLGDTPILNNTLKSTNDKGYQQLSFVLPSGRKVVSEWIDPNQLKGQVFIQWCNVVRDQDEADIAEREAAEEIAIANKRTRALTSPAPSTEHVPVRSNVPVKYETGSVVQSVETSQDLSTKSSAANTLRQLGTSALPDDPTDLVGSKLRALRIQLAEVQDQLSELSLEEQNLQRSIVRWEAVEISLAGPSVALPSVPSAMPRNVRPGQIIMLNKE
jgi:hypothetical protein